MIANPYYVLDGVTDLHYLYDQTDAVLDIRYEYDLNDANITVGSGCVLKFNGGKLKNGTLTLCENEIVGEGTCFTNIKFRGNYSGEFRLRWIGICAGNTSTNDQLSNHDDPYSNYLLLSRLYTTFLFKITKFVIEGTINIYTNGIEIPGTYSIRGENQAKLVFSAPVTSTVDYCMAFIAGGAKLSDIEIFYNYLNMTEIADPNNNTDSSAITMLDIDTNRRLVYNQGQPNETSFSPNDFTLCNVSFSQKSNATDVKKYNATAIRITCTNETYKDKKNYITHSLVSNCFIKNVGTGVVINNTNIDDSLPDHEKCFAWANQIYFDRLYIAASDKGLDVTVKDLANPNHNKAYAQFPFIISSYEFQALIHSALAFVIDGGKFLIENFSSYDNNSTGDHVGEVRSGVLSIGNFIAGLCSFHYGLSDSLGTYDNKGGIYVYNGAQLVAKHFEYTDDKIMLAQEGFHHDANVKTVIESLKHGLACKLTADDSTKAFASYRRFTDDNSALYRVQYANQDRAQQTEVFKESFYDNIQANYGEKDFNIFLRYRPAIAAGNVTCYVMPYNIQLYRIRITDSLAANTLYKLQITFKFKFDGQTEIDGQYIGYSKMRELYAAKYRDIYAEEHGIPEQEKPDIVVLNTPTFVNLGITSADVDVLSYTQFNVANTNNLTVKVRGKGNTINGITLIARSVRYLNGSTGNGTTSGNEIGVFGKIPHITDFMDYYIYDASTDATIIGKEKGTSSQRPTALVSSDSGFTYYDGTLKKMILWNGTTWVNMDGSTL